MAELLLLASRAKRRRTGIPRCFEQGWIRIGQGQVRIGKGWVRIGAGWVRIRQGWFRIYCYCKSFSIAFVFICA